MIVFLITALLWVTFCTAMRKRHLNDLLRRYAHFVDNPSELTYKDAQRLLMTSQTLDMPFISRTALEFALFKTYCIPSISALLIATGRLTSPASAGKRAEDTGQLIAEWIIPELDSERASLAIARTNWIHSLYKGKISNEDMLYVLSAFILEPIRWIGMHEWRALTSLEAHARFVFWSEVGRRMEIEGLWSSLEECEQYNAAYEQEYMVYAKSNEITGQHTLDIMVSIYPKPLRRPVQTAVTCLLPDTVRAAMGIPKPPRWLALFISTALAIRKLLLRYALPPRPSFLPKRFVDEHKNSKGRYNRHTYSFQPFYTAPSWINRIIWGEPSPWRHDGYKIEELGPIELETKGLDEVRENAARMRCPMG